MPSKHSIVFIPDPARRGNAGQNHPEWTRVSGAEDAEKATSKSEASEGFTMASAKQLDQVLHELTNLHTTAWGITVTTTSRKLPRTTPRVTKYPIRERQFVPRWTAQPKKMAPASPIRQA